ncbi:MAG TPA: YfiR family protein [Vicinamibacterales bacterium]|jgi:hypothetical protein|nr:YfiR family protein [Vicinamibacterales bacterium]
MMRGHRRILAACVAAVFAAISVAGADAQSPRRSEYEVKAAYLFTFARFVEWTPRPSRDDSSFTICILGADPFGATLDMTLSEAVIRGRRVGARRISEPDAAAGCHIVFVSTSEDRRMADLVPLLAGAGVLTVSDMPKFTERGGMIQFVTAANRVRFEINLQSARQAGLMMSSELLRVASAVRNATGSM